MRLRPLDPRAAAAAGFAVAVALSLLLGVEGWRRLAAGMAVALAFVLAAL